MVDKNIELFLNEEEVKKVKFNYNITSTIDNSYSKGDNLGYVDIIIDDDVLYTYDIYLNDNIYERTSPSTVLVTVLILLVLSIFALIFINILLGRN